MRLNASVEVCIEKICRNQKRYIWELLQTLWGSNLRIWVYIYRSAHHFKKTTQICNLVIKNVNIACNKGMFWQNLWYSQKFGWYWKYIALNRRRKKSKKKNNVTCFYDIKSYIIWDVISDIMCTKNVRNLK